MITNEDPDSAAPEGRLMYHCDSMWSDEPFEVLSLHAIKVEPPVLPTMYVSATYAWKALPDDLKARVKDLNALHVPGPGYVHDRRSCLFPGELVQSRRSRVPTYSQNLAWTHPRTGETILFVTQGAREILELPSEEGGPARGAVRSPLRARTGLRARVARGRAHLLGQPGAPARPALRHDAGAGRSRGRAPVADLAPRTRSAHTPKSAGRPGARLPAPLTPGRAGHAVGDSTEREAFALGENDQSHRSSTSPARSRSGWSTSVIVGERHGHHGRVPAWRPR
jgi:hypothetical protein